MTDAASSSPKTSTLFRRLWRDWAFPHRWALALNLGCITLFAGANAAYLPIIRDVVDALEAKNAAMLALGPALVIAATAIKSGALYAHKRLTNSVMTQIETALQRRMYASLIDGDLARMANEAPASYAARFITDIQYLRAALEQTVTALLRDVLTVATIFMVMMIMDWRLTLAALLIAPVAAWPIAEIGRRLRGIARATQQQVGDMTALLSESLGGLALAKTYRLEPYLKDRAGASFERLRQLKLRAVNAHALIDPLLEVLAGLAVAGILYLVGTRILAGQNSLGDFMAFVTALLLAAQPMRALGNLNAALQQGAAAAERVFALFDAHPTIVSKLGAPALPVGAGDVAFDSVAFSYAGGARAVDGLSLEISGGTTVALVGRSGAGKSTLFHLIPRLYDVTGGAIKINGQDIREATVDSVRGAVAVVSQHPVLFDDTVRANIAFGRPGASDADIISAATAAAAHEFICALPGGYDAPVGVDGSRLSGGQRQRISIARAVLRDAPILLLDEATSALDAESEHAVKQALAQLSKGRTTLVIAHRLSTILDADEIIVMEAGRMVERGRHADLLAAEGVYAAFYRKQFGGI